MEDKRCSRRQFVTAAVAGAGVLATRTAGADGAAAPATAAQLPTKWHGCSDVVVVGFGAAGAAAAYEAAAAGAKVAVLDSSQTGGGDTAISGGYVFIGGGTALQVAAGYNETPEQMFRVVRAMGGIGADPENIRVWCERGPELFNWLTTQIGLSYERSGLVFGGMEQHAEFRALAPNEVPVPHSHLAVGGEPLKQGAPLFAKLSAAARGARGVTFKGQTKATRLIQDPVSKRILGVVARSVDETGAFVACAPEQYLMASKGVVIATGAFSANAPMLARHSPDLLKFVHWSQPNADGTGIHMAQLAGADLRLMKAYWALVFFAGEPTTAKGILVSPRGSRFVAEDGGYTWIAHHMIAEQPTAYLIFDQAIATAPAGSLTGETIEELVDAINERDQVGMSPELLRATLDGYNALASTDGGSSRDPAFLKDPQYVLPIGTRPPYCAVRHTSAAEAFGTTSGGLRVNAKTEVLDPGGTPIGGLYAAGTCASLNLSDRYTGGGTAIAGALIFGRIAGQQVAALHHWHR